MSEETLTFPLRETEIPWGLMEYNGINTNMLRSNPELMRDLLRGVENTNTPIMMNEQLSKADEEQMKASGRTVPAIKDRPKVDGSVRLYIDKEKNTVKLILTTRRPFPDFKGKDRTYMGHTFTDEDIFMLLSTNSIGRSVTLTTPYGESFEAFVSMNPITNAIRHMRSDNVEKRIPTQVLGHTFTPEERATLQRGDIIHLTGLKSKYGDKTFDAYYMFNAASWGTQFISERAIKGYQRTRGVISQFATEMKEVLGVVKHNDEGTLKKPQPTLTPPKAGKGAKKSV